MKGSLAQLQQYKQELADAADRISKAMVRVELAISIAESEPDNRTAWMQAVSTKENIEA